MVFARTCTENSDTNGRERKNFPHLLGPRRTKDRFYTSLSNLCVGVRDPYPSGYLEGSYSPRTYFLLVTKEVSV